MIENILKLMSDTKPKIHEAQSTPGKIKAQNTTPRDISSKLQKIKDKEKNPGRSQGVWRGTLQPDRNNIKNNIKLLLRILARNKRVTEKDITKKRKLQTNISHEHRCKNP